MGRPLRVIEPNGVYHAGSRGNNRGQVAWDDEDYRALLEELGRAATHLCWRVLAYCHMPNHRHLVLQAPHGGFSSGFKQMNGNYSRRTNRRYGREGHLWKNHPWVRDLRSPVAVALATVYVFRNPIEAGLCEWSQDWPHSSYRATMGLEPAPPWLDVDGVLELLGPDREEARRVLERLVHREQYPVSDTGLWF